MPYEITHTQLREAAQHIQIITNRNAKTVDHSMASGRLLVLFTRLGIPKELHTRAAVEAEFRAAFSKESNKQVAAAMGGTTILRPVTHGKATQQQ